MTMDREMSLLSIEEMPPDLCLNQIGQPMKGLGLRKTMSVFKMGVVDLLAVVVVEVCFSIMRKGGNLRYSHNVSVSV